jgi:FkbM family methyltransferase
MRNRWTDRYQQAKAYGLRLVAQGLTQLTGRGAGRLAPWLPPGQVYQVPNYCGGFKFNIDTTYPMESTVWLGGTYDRPTTQFLQTVLRPDDVCLDIGANCGALTLVAASVIQTGHIYAFEPAPAIRARLEGNIASNPGLADRVTVVNLGLGQERGQLCYQEDPNFRGNGSLFHPGEIQSGEIQVEIITLDEWITTQAIARVNVIKIDVEGMEYAVFQGAQALLTRDHPLIYFETMPNNLIGKSHAIADVYQYLSQLGYRLINPTQPTQAIDWNAPPDNSIAVYGEDFDRLARLR